MSDLNALNLEPGALIGGYTLVSRLGAGAMGSVWRVNDGGGQEYAMKILRDSLSEDGVDDGDDDALRERLTARERLRREAMALKRVNHPGVCGIVDMELDDSVAFIVTELIEGRNLRDDVKANGRYTGDDLERLARKLIEAVKAVHAAGIVHRDLKPTNVMVAASGPIIVDFGIAMSGGESHVTRTGLVMGTPGFIAPEIIDGAESDEMTDWWSLASVLAFAATGAPVFGTKPMMAVLERAAAGNANLTGLPAGTMNAFRAALHPDRRRRCTPDQLLHAIMMDALDPFAWRDAALESGEMGVVHPFDGSGADNPRLLWRRAQRRAAGAGGRMARGIAGGVGTSISEAGAGMPPAPPSPIATAGGDPSAFVAPSSMPPMPPTVDRSAPPVPPAPSTASAAVELPTDAPSQVMEMLPMDVLSGGAPALDDTSADATPETPADATDATDATDGRSADQPSDPSGAVPPVPPDESTTVLSPAGSAAAVPSAESTTMPSPGESTTVLPPAAMPADAPAADSGGRIVRNSRNVPAADRAPGMPAAPTSSPSDGTTVIAAPVTPPGRVPSFLAGAYGSETAARGEAAPTSGEWTQSSLFDQPSADGRPPAFLMDGDERSDDVPDDDALTEIGGEPVDDGPSGRAVRRATGTAASGPAGDAAGDDRTRPRRGWFGRRLDDDADDTYGAHDSYDPYGDADDADAATRRARYLSAGSGVVTLLLIPLALVAASIPLAAVLAAGALLWALFTFGFSVDARLSREERRGGRTSTDGLVQAASLPWHLLRAAGAAAACTLALGVFMVVVSALAALIFDLPTSNVTFGPSWLTLPMAADAPLSAGGVVSAAAMAVGWLTATFSHRTSAVRLGAGALAGSARGGSEDGSPTSTRTMILAAVWLTVTLAALTAMGLGSPIDWWPFAGESW
ncbi:protein kinase [Bifidobacterium samirii]|uniref:Protein kinase n=1 Tax=Bifidobacterium samirii TaxID=2306974 RepID=A0A430FVD2_9BIFI|nr:serine/threonine-protein kinase [Bifidobacterium samirii]RSX57443.1 protein kinase [Bifidobacterium samirii]